MKRFFVVAAVALILSSCSLHRANVASTPVYSPAVETLTMASLEVSAKKISYKYTPVRRDSKSLSVEQLVKNAIYAALQENGNADELIEVNYYVSTKFGLFGKRVKSISVSGYPAYYVNFREPTATELEGVESLSKARMMRQSSLKSISVDKF